MSDTPRADSLPIITVFDSNGQPYESELCEISEYQILERELAETKLKLEEVVHVEQCASCNGSYDPSLVEGGDCIFCIHKASQAENAKLRVVAQNAITGMSQLLVNAAFGVLPHVLEKRQGEINKIRAEFLSLSKVAPYEKEVQS